MGQVLRITHNDIDYSFKILNEEPLSRETVEIAVLVNETTLTLVRDEHSWVPKEENEVAQEQVRAIGKAISLRYRI
jgi:hypothetical protein